MKKIYFTILIVISSFVFFGCSKQTETLKNNDSQQQYNVENPETIYRHLGRNIDKTTIDFNSSDLTLLYGYSDNQNEVLVFFNNGELISWAKQSNDRIFIIRILDNVSLALEKAKEMGEFEYAEQHGDVSQDYKNFLLSLVHYTGTRNVNGVTNLFADINYQGHQEFIGVPRWSLGSFNKKASSIQFSAVGTTLFAKKWWRGSKAVFYTVYYGQDPDLRNAGFNDKTSSVWIW